MINTNLFGILPDGREVSLFTLQNKNGMQVEISDFGCIIKSIVVPDRNGNFSDVVLGFDDLQGYLDHNLYFGCVVGRYANRIANGKFILDGVEYKLAQNLSPNHLHGGIVGLDKVLWSAKKLNFDDLCGLQMSYTSPDGDQGYPGELKITVSYLLKADNSIEIKYEAETNKPTIINLTNHTYFNLKDGGKSNIADHILNLNADHFVPVNQFLIPLGGFRKVAGTPHDFINACSIGDRINADDEQIRFGNGYDHSWLINQSEKQLSRAAKVTEHSTGRILEVRTSHPAIHLYTGNFLNGTFEGKNGSVYQKRSGFCLETQYFADGPNQPEFPTTELRPSESYEHLTIFKFGILE